MGGRDVAGETERPERGVVVAADEERGRDDREALDATEECLLERGTGVHRSQHERPAIERGLEPLEAANPGVAVGDEGRAQSTRRPEQRLDVARDRAHRLFLRRVIPQARERRAVGGLAGGQAAFGSLAQGEGRERLDALSGRRRELRRFPTLSRGLARQLGPAPRVGEGRHRAAEPRELETQIVAVARARLLVAPARGTRDEAATRVALRTQAAAGRRAEELVEALLDLLGADPQRVDLLGDAAELVALVDDDLGEGGIVGRPAQQEVVVRDHELRLREGAAVATEGAALLVATLLARALIRAHGHARAQQLAQPWMPAQQRSRHRPDLPAGRMRAHASSTAWSACSSPCSAGSPASARTAASRRSQT